MTDGDISELEIAMKACAYQGAGSSAKIHHGRNTIRVHCSRKAKHDGLCRGWIFKGIWLQWKRGHRDVTK